MTPTERYADLRIALLSGGEAEPQTSKGFGTTALTVGGKIFCMLPRGRLVVKLPKARVDALVEAGWGARFDANKGVAMKQWLTVDPSREGDWQTLAEEALAFVKAEKR